MSDPYNPPQSAPPAGEPPERGSKMRSWVLQGVVALAILAVIVAVALPQYGGYTPRARVSEVILSLSDGRTTLVDFIARHDRLPRDAKELGWPGPGEQVSRYVRARSYDGTKGELVAVAQGIGRDVDGKSVRMKPTLEMGAVSWRCYSPDMPPKYLPASCRE
jgi:type II secretory pathway pseudopilin PulG